MPYKHKITPKSEVVILGWMFNLGFCHTIAGGDTSALIGPDFDRWEYLAGRQGAIYMFEKVKKGDLI